MVDLVFGWGWGSGWGRGEEEVKGGRSNQDISNYSIFLCNIGAGAVSLGGPKKGYMRNLLFSHS